MPESHSDLLSDYGRAFGLAGAVCDNVRREETVAKELASPFDLASRRYSSNTFSSAASQAG